MAYYKLVCSVKLQTFNDVQNFGAEFCLKCMYSVPTYNTQMRLQRKLLVLEFINKCSFTASHHNSQPVPTPGMQSVQCLISL